MINNLIAVLGTVADILAILSIWFIEADSPIWVKLLVTMVALLVGIAIILLAHDTYDIKVKKYHYKNNEDEFRVYTKKNKFLVEGSIVSVYYKYREFENTCDKLVAIGYVFFDEKEKDVEIKIFKIIEDSLMRNILASNKSCKNYHIKPNIDYMHISDIIIDESEANYNV